MVVWNLLCGAWTVMCRFLIGTVLTMTKKDLAESYAFMCRFLIGTVLTRANSGRKADKQDVSIPHRYGSYTTNIIVNVSDGVDVSIPHRYGSYTA